MLFVFKNLEPITMSASLSSIGLMSFGISSGSCCPSASSVTMMSAFRSLAVLKHVCIAAP